MFATTKSLKGNKCAQVFSAKTSSGFIRWNQKLNGQAFEHSQKMSEYRQI
jgi:hypothetical protein